MRTRATPLILFLAMLLGSFGLADGVERPNGDAAPPAPASGVARDGVLRRAISSFRVFDGRDGLPQNTVKAIAFDRNRYLWVGTQDGAAFYNGRKWHAVSMPSRNGANWINTICATSDGSLFFGTNGAGVCKLKDGVWTVFDSETSPLADGFVNQIVELPSGGGATRLLIVTGSDLYELDGDAWRVLDRSSGFPKGEIAFALPTGDELWVGTENGAVRRSGDRWETFTVDSGLPDNLVYCLAEGADEQGNRVLWAGTDAGVARFRDGRWEAVGGPDGPVDRSVFTMLTTSSDGVETLWAGTDAGLFEYEAGAWHHFSTATGMPDNSVVSLLELRPEDGTRAILVGTLAGGMASLGFGNWMTIDARSGLPDDHVYSFLETEAPDGSPVVWVGTYGGLARLDHGEWTVFKAGRELPNDKINCLLEQKHEDGRQTVWVGTFGGLARYEDGRWSVVDSTSGLPNDGVRSLLETRGEDGQPVLWVGTYRGLARLEDGRWSVYDTASGLPNNQVMALARTVSADGRETIWAGTLGGGLARFENGQWSVVDSKSGLPNDLVRGLRVVTGPDGRRSLWVGTLGGVAWLDLDTPDAPWNVLSDATTPALPNNVVYDVRADAAGRIYLPTNRGVARLTPREPTADDPSRFAVYDFTILDGLPSNECNGGASMVDSRGRVWVGTTSGAAFFDPGAERTRASVPPLHVERTFVNGSPFEPGGDERLRPLAPSFHETTLAYDENEISFEYALLSYFKESDTMYRSQLVGLEDAPTEWSADGKRTFPRLPGGDYVFKVWGRDFAGTVTGPAEVVFRIRTAPWKTWWAFVLYAVALMGIGYGATRMRLRSVERHNRLLEGKVVARTSELDGKNHELAEAIEQLTQSERRANEANRAKSIFLATMSHELRTPLNAILGFVQLMQRKGRLDTENREYLRIILRSGEHLLGLINDVLSISKIEAGKIFLTPAVFSLDDLLRNVEELLRGRAESKGLTLSFDVADDLPRSVHGDDGKLRQILINLLGNAIKFTETGSVTMRVRWRDERASFEIADTGPGISSEEMKGLFEPFVQTEVGRKSAEGTGLGLTITRAFVWLMGGEIFIESEVGRGTSFRFDVDLPAAEQEAREAERTVIGLEPGQPKIRILAVDDVWENRRLLVDLLGSLGFEMREAATGVAACDLVASWKPDAVLMDVRMPEMDGDEATKRIRALEEGDRKITIVALSASVFPHDRQAILDAGCDAFLAKPIQANELLDTIGRLVGIRYVYADPATPEPQLPVGAVEGEDLGRLPAPLLERLRLAVEAGAVQEAATVIEEVRAHDDVTAGRLAALLKGYRLDEIASAISQATTDERRDAESTQPAAGRD